MRLEEEKDGRRNELQFELKYCERCGGLWLRRVGKDEVYCAGCARAVAELPAVSHDVEDGSEEEIRWKEANDEGLEDGLGIDVDAWGGVA